MNLRIFTLGATLAGCLTYSASKVHLALEGRLGMPGFDAPPESYALYDAFSGQLGNALVGLVLAILVLPLFRLRHRWWGRWLLLLVNAAAALGVTSLLVRFLLRATGVLSGGPAPEGLVPWLTLLVGAVWSTCWFAALTLTLRQSPLSGTGNQPRQAGPPAGTIGPESRDPVRPT